MKPYLGVTLGYLAFGIAWILTSDHIAGLVAGSIQDLAYFQTLKGLLYVCLSALLICCLTRRAFQRQTLLHREKENVFRKVIECSHHILLNYLNQMQLVTLEAERCADFDRPTLKMARDASQHANTELLRLREIEQISADRIDSVVYREIRKP